MLHPHFGVLVTDALKDKNLAAIKENSDESNFKYYEEDKLINGQSHVYNMSNKNSDVINSLSTDKIVDIKSLLGHLEKNSLNLRDCVKDFIENAFYDNEENQDDFKKLSSEILNSINNELNQEAVGVFVTYINFNYKIYSELLEIFNEEAKEIC